MTATRRLAVPRKSALICMGLIRRLLNTRLVVA